MTYKIMHGNCLDQMMYPNEPVDLILFDPPFMPFNGKPYQQVREETQHKLEKIITPENYLEWWKELCMISNVFLKPSGWFCFKSDSWTAKMTFPITQNMYRYSGEVVWDKGCIGLGRYIRVRHEYIECFFARGDTKHYWRYPQLKKVTAKFHGNSDGTYAFQSLFQVSNFNNGTLGKVDKNTHINQTPPEVWTKFIEYMSPPNGLILDLCCGTASVGIEALRLKRNYWGIELDPKFIPIAEKNCRYVSKHQNKRLSKYDHE